MLRSLTAITLAGLLALAGSGGHGLAVPPPVTLAVDASAAIPGVQASSTTAVGTTFTADIVIASVADLEAFNFELEYDQTVVSAPTLAAGPSTERNPDAQDAILTSTGRTWSCSPPDPSGDSDPDPGIGVAFLSCFSTGANPGPGAASNTALARVTFTALAVGTSSLTLRQVNTFKALGVETGSCNPIVVAAASCTGATITVALDLADDDGDGHWDGDETAKGSNPLSATSTPEQCDGIDNDGDTVVDEAPTGGNWDIDGDTTADCLDANVDSDGDGLMNPSDADDDGDGFTDARENSMATDSLDGCPAALAPDALPSDGNRDTDLDVGDVIILFYGKIFDPPDYSKRSDFDADGDVDVGDLVIAFYGKIFTTCQVFTFTNTTGADRDRIDITFNSSITVIFSALDNTAPQGSGRWSTRDVTGNPVIILRRPTGNLANGGVLTVVTRAPTSPAVTVSSSAWSLETP